VVRSLPIPRTILLHEREAAGGILKIPFVPAIDLNHSEVILQSVFRAEPAVGVIASALVMGLGAWIVHSLVRQRKSPWAVAAAFGFAAAILVNQAVVAGILAVLAVKLGEKSAPAAIRQGGRLLFGLGMSVVIILAASALAFGADRLTERTFLRLFFAMPSPFYRLLFFQFPLMLLITLAGCVYIFLKSLPENADHRLFFVAVAFVSPLLIMGFFRAPYVAYRYNYYLNPLFVILFSWSILQVTEVVAHRLAGAGSARGRGWIQAVFVFLILLFACEEFDPQQS
jgi:hypothetical protein